MGTMSWSLPSEFVIYDKNSVVSKQTSSVVETNTDLRPLTVRNRVVNGWRKPSAYYRTVETGNVKTVEFNKDYMKTNGLRYTSHGSSDCSGNWDRSMPSAPPGLEDRAIINARLKLKNSAINIAQNIGERKQTAGLVFDSCLRLFRMVKNVKRTALHLATDPFNLWLELQYGWKPLLSDIHGAVKALHEKEKGKPQRSTCIATAQSRDNGMRSLGIGFAPAVIVDQYYRTVHNVKVRLDFEIKNQELAEWSAYGITNPLDLAWELLPFSFVVDWFVPIGDFFNCLDATFGWNFKGGTCSTVSRMNYWAGGTRIDPALASTYPKGYSTARGKASKVQFTRTVYSSAPLPDFPYYKDKSSSLHVANGIALLGGAFTNSKRIVRL